MSNFFKIFLVSAQTASTTRSLDSLEMSMLNILTAIEALQDESIGITKDIDNSKTENLGAEELLPILSSLSNCDAKTVALHKLQTFQ